MCHRWRAAAAGECGGGRAWFLQPLAFAPSATVVHARAGAGGRRGGHRGDDTGLHFPKGASSGGAGGRGWGWKGIRGCWLLGGIL